MTHDTLVDFLKNGTEALAKGPIALILVEDMVAVEATIRHHIIAGFKSVILFAPEALPLPDELSTHITRVNHPLIHGDDTETIVNGVINAAQGQWVYYCYNAEFLFHPFFETRTISEMLAFHAEERRDAMLAYVIDLYAGDLHQHPDAVSLEHAYLDKSGYYALGRHADGGLGNPLERQLDFYGGLRWRFEEHIPKARRRIDRIPLFKAKPGLKLRADHTFNEPEYNTYSCPWHHNITLSLMSFRTAKALKANAGSRYDIDSFHWHNSVEFKWQSQQLLDLGLMEPGQWF